MKYEIRKNIDFSNISRYIPKQFLTVIDKALSLKIVNIIQFPGDKKDIVLSRSVTKAFKELGNSDNKTIVLGGCFTVEARNLISSYNSLSFALDYFEWTDESYTRIRQTI